MLMLIILTLDSFQFQFVAVLIIFSIGKNLHGCESLFDPEWLDQLTNALFTQVAKSYSAKLFKEIIKLFFMNEACKDLHLQKWLMDFRLECHRQATEK